MATILCVDDEPAVGVVMEHALTTMGHRPVLASNVEDAMKVVAAGGIDLILTDYIMPGLNGMDFIRQLQRDGYDMPIVMITGFASIENAVIAIKSGATDYLTKPVDPATLELAVTQALEGAKQRRENEGPKVTNKKGDTSRAIVGDSHPFRRIMEMIATVAPTRATVLLQGESGTGKEVFARAVHDQSPRANGAFVTINCAAMPEGLVESALFGHEKGAFTGATVRTAGAFERAHGGTLLLDEISEMRLDLQAKLLRVIQEQEFERVGGTQPIKVDVRLIATTNRDLKTEVKGGRFRSDLYYRLNVMPIRTVPLRDRIEDIPRLVYHFMQRAAESLGTPVPTIAPETMRILQSYEWPGNVRELANAIERAVILARNGALLPSHFIGHLSGTPVHGVPVISPNAPPPPNLTSSFGTPTLSHPITDMTTHMTTPTNGHYPVPSYASATNGDQPLFDLEEIERQTIQRALTATGGNRTRAAKLMGISERTLRNKLNGPKATPDSDEAPSEH